MVENKFSITDKGYFGISFLHVDKYASNLVGKTVNKMVARQNGLIFTDAISTYNEARSSLTVEGIAINLTNEEIALNGLMDCVDAVRGLKPDSLPLAG